MRQARTRAEQQPDPDGRHGIGRPVEYGSAVAGAAGVLTAGAVLVMIGARVTAIDPPVPLHAFVHADDANAVAARALHLINGHAHHVAPVSTLTSSSCSCGSIKCSI